MKRLLPLLGAAALGSLGLALSAGAVPALAAETGDGLTVDLIEPGDERLSVLLTLPEGFVVDDLDAGGSRVLLGGEEATAAVDSQVATIRRTAVLAIDTSDSMLEDDRLEAAETAALDFIDGIPAEVEVGVVTFDAAPTVVLAPTTDHDAARVAVSDLATDPDTALYDAVGASVELAGSEGLRQVLLVSDGEDTVGGDAPATVRALQASGVKLDAIALDDDSDLAALTTLADASGGSVVQATSDDLAGVLAQQAEDLTNQVALDVVVPEGVTGATADLRVELVSTDGETASASAVAPLGDLAPAASAAPTSAAAPASSSAFTLPSWALYAGTGVFAIGLVAALALAAPRRTAPSAADRVMSYTAAVSAQQTRAPGPEEKREAEDPLATAKGAAAQVLQRNRGLEARISARLEGAGSALKPAEWLLVHLGLFVLAGFVGVLVGGGNIIVGLLFLLVGAFAPWLYLGRRRTKRRKAFDAALPDTLQLMSGALSAGLSLAQACDTIARDGQEPVASEFKRVLVETRLGVSVDDALADAAERFDSKDFRWVVMAIRIQREVGGNLAELLKTVAGTMREREYLRRQVKALSAEGRLSAIILAALPPGFMLFQLISNASYIMPLFTDPRGWVLLGGAVLMLAIGAFWMSRMVKVEV